MLLVEHLTVAHSCYSINARLAVRSHGERCGAAIPPSDPFPRLWQVFVESLKLDIYQNELAIGKLFFIRRSVGKRCLTPMATCGPSCLTRFHWVLPPGHNGWK